MKHTPEDLFFKAYGEGKNFMTPNVLKIAWLVPDKVAYEISEGRGIEHERIYGLTVVAIDKEGEVKRLGSPVSDCFRSKSQLKRRIERIKKGELWNI